MGFIPYKAKQWLQGTELEKKEEKDEKHFGKLFIKKKKKNKRCLLTVDLEPFRTHVKGKHFAGRKFHSLAVLWKKVLT